MNPVERVDRRAGEEEAFFVEGNDEERGRRRRGVLGGDVGDDPISTKLPSCDGGRRKEAVESLSSRLVP